MLDPIYVISHFHMNLFNHTSIKNDIKMGISFLYELLWLHFNFYIVKNGKNTFDNILV